MSAPAPTSTGGPRRGDAALLDAMTKTVAARGYRETSVADVLGRAGIARSTFYARYPNKERCFTDAVDRIVGEALATVRDAVPDLGSPRELLGPPIAALLEAVAAQPEAARAVLIETHAAGDEADARRRAAHQLLIRMVRRALGPKQRPAPLADALASAICGGIETLLVSSVRTGRTDELPPLAAPLAAWAAGYRSMLAPEPVVLPPAPAQTPSRRRGQAPGSLVPVGPSGRRGLPPGPKREPRDAIARTVRDRLLDATVTVAAEHGYDALTVAAIVARAETSRRSFYEHFDTIPEAFVAAMRLGAEAATAATLTAYAARRDPAAGVVAAFERLAAFLAEEPAFARAALLAAPAAGVDALAARGAALDALAGIVADAHRRLGAASDVDLIADLSAGATLALCVEHLRADPPTTLPERVPLVAAIALAPVLEPPAIVAAIEDALATP